MVCQRPCVLFAAARGRRVLANGFCLAMGGRVPRKFRAAYLELGPL